MMVKIAAIFVEGYTELEFVFHLIKNYHQFSDIFIQTWELKYDGNLENINTLFGNLDIAGKKYLIINVGGDEGITGAINSRYDDLKRNGYRKIIGLRDVAPKYKIEQVEMLKKAMSDNLKNSDAQIFLAIMEIEAWILAEYTLFSKFDRNLNTELIKKQLSVDLTQVDPEIAFKKPKNNFHNILSLSDKYKNKKKWPHNSIVKSIMNCIDYGKYFVEIKKQNKISAFYEFLSVFE